ncbi:MAG: hypothetical protein ACOYJL_04260 [Tractidigestivibacter sp.]|jgi:hypothetical protein|uniref:hypothetical protein n=1 Tax=Tractidigestivibacter sp. TaxID=2847320 RepID=UPI003D9405DA
MAEAEKPLDLTRTLDELEKSYPELSGQLAELGFESPDVSKTIPELALEADVDISIIAFALQMDDYDVQNYEPADKDYKSPLGDIVSVLFDGTYLGEPLPQTSSSAPMLSHMEMAIRRAQEEGKLPKDNR